VGVLERAAVRAGVGLLRLAQRHRGHVVDRLLRNAERVGQTHAVKLPRHLRLGISRERNFDDEGFSRIERYARFVSLVSLQNGWGCYENSKTIKLNEILISTGNINKFERFESNVNFWKHTVVKHISDKIIDRKVTIKLN